MADRKDIRIKRLEATYRETIQNALRTSVGDVRLAREIITITRVKISEDWSVADVHVTALDPPNRGVIVKALHSAAPLFLTLLKQKVKIRFLPALRFKWDEEHAEADEIVGLLDRLKATGGRKPDADAAPGEPSP